MTNDEVGAIVGHTPHMTRAQADQITQLITDQGIQSILELGFKPGVSTSFMAALMQPAFFLVDWLLIPGGWIVFDDFDWTYDSSP